MKKGYVLAASILAVLGGVFWFSTRSASDTTTAPLVVQPALSALAARGEAVYFGTCAACHGENLTGTESGPPLIHPLYRPGHHSDYSFVRAVQNGVHPHHWPFGAMPPQPHIDDDALIEVIRYIREVQRANGIE